MLPANVMSFVKKMVTQPDSAATAAATTDSITPDEGGTTFSKLRQLGSGLMMATGNVTKLTPAKVTPVEDTQPKEDTSALDSLKPKTDIPKSASSGDECRICRKSFGPEEVSRICCECQHKVCEDCASYSTTTNSDDPSSWQCSVCRRKIASRGQAMVGQQSTDSLLEVPGLEALVRRHSDAKLGCQSVSQVSGLATGLVPPRSPDIRRHSDVSPASLKELEKFRKVAGDRRDDLRWDKDFDRKSKSRSGSPDRLEKGRAASPQRIVKSPAQPDADTTVDIVKPEEDVDQQQDEEEQRWIRTRRASTAVVTAAAAAASSARRKSRVTRQRSYDDEIKTLLGGASSGSAQAPQQAHPDSTGTVVLLPTQLSRRASAYDVFGAHQGGLNAMAIAAAQQRASISVQGSSREADARPTGRRSSFRNVKPMAPYEVDDKLVTHDAPTSSAAGLVPDEERRTKRRGSQLPDINAIRAGVAANVSSGGSASATAVDDRDLLARQGSLADGEGIKIVIHDVDSERVPRVNSKRRVFLRKDPAFDKGHRTRGFGMRVVGGKRGADGRTFAYIVWTVPGGPAEKAGLQQGDKVLEWSSLSLTDRSFEEVAQIIERTDDMAELLVEQGTDIIGDLLDDPSMPSQSGKGPGSLGLHVETDTEKTPSSPTRRKLPKTPEQIAKERQVSGRVQIQVSYENERRELIVSVFTADDLCAREDTGYGTLPEAYAKLLLVPPCGDQMPLKTMVAEPTQKPIWNATLFFSGVSGESLMDRAIEVTLWDCTPDNDNVFLGECRLDLQRALEDDRAVWYRLEDPRGLRSGKSPYCSPRGSLSMEVAQRLLRKTELRERSYSDDTQSDSGSPELCFLHPDHAWHANSRRGSSQSEQLEVEPYELTKDYSRSLPGSRRSSFQSQGTASAAGSGTDSKRGSIGENDIPIVAHYNRDRRRSSVSRPLNFSSDKKRRGSQFLIPTPTVIVCQCDGEPVSSFPLAHSTSPR
ncbi:regulating synaptic membrane exocytosis protein 1 isoform X2 [Prorops nasuta]|uniref:regulating synaptic membrane exocytosis protein 1 isoform X2 n=1 Tax=Prorops nasuta TaxID=863751 RepID=UPI0034CD02D3